ncbi:hypothetical protein MKJ04_15140 [Pontibacter sp. E15-1]|uniref:hypothetical protein n=1 Tax=Pontibacter sp. E15-1 TaxID=2919918 RepID=UPI001F5033DA|nr:hypothetical protein [Pontibacter sp. E15-1]MCJ8166181.1 hypothetical protein [Pontibacter sp. E15-1]
MLIFWMLVIGAIVGYLYGYYLKPNRQLRKAIQAAQATGAALLEEGHKGVYSTTVTEQNQSSELVVEVQELAVTEAGKVKVTYLSAFYKNPVFRTRKGEALLREVRDLLGDYLPISDIEWYENSARQASIRQRLNSLDNLHQQQLGE